MNIISQFSDRKFWRSTIRLALPIALQNLLVTSFSIIDNIMIGNIPNSENAISAVGMAGQIAFFLNITIFGICSGGSVFAAQFWGAGNTKGIRRTYGIVTVFCLGVSALFCLCAQLFPEALLGMFTSNADIRSLGVDYIKIASFSYIGIALNLAFSTILRSVEIVDISMIASGASVVMNIGLNYIFIYGKLGFPAMGVRGAAIATVISALANPAIILLISFIKKNILRSPLRDVFSFTRESLKSFFRIALPVMLNETMWGAGIIVYNIIIGHMPPDGNYTALIISRNIHDVMFVFFIGVCNACAVLVGKSVGCGDTEKAKDYAKKYLLLFPFMGIVLGALLICLRMPILSLYTLGDYVRETASVLIIIFCCEMPIRHIPYICIVGIFRAGGDTKTGMKFDLGTLWLCGIPLTAIAGLVFKLDFRLVYLIMVLAEDVPKTLLALRYFRSYKWIKPVNVQETPQQRQ